MRRHLGENLRDGCAIALVANDAIGNFVIATPLAQMLRARHAPARLDLFSGARSMELAGASPLFSHAYAPFGAAPSDGSGPLPSGLPAYDLVVNIEWSGWAKTLAGRLARAGAGVVCGPATEAAGADLPFGDDPRARLWQDQGWVSPDLRARYPFLQSGWIAEIFCRLAFLEGAVPAYQVPQADPTTAPALAGARIPDLLVACSASLPEKLWGADAWEEALRFARDQGLEAGLLGAPRRSQGAFWQGADAEDRLVAGGLVRDLRGAFTLPQVVGALARARAVLTLDNGIMHLAAAVQTPTVALFREGIHRLWTPPAPHIHPVVAAPGAPVSTIPIAPVRVALAAASGASL